MGDVALPVKTYRRDAEFTCGVKRRQDVRRAPRRRNGQEDIARAAKAAQPPFEHPVKS